MLLYCSCFLKLFYFSGSPLFCQCTHYFCLQVASLLMHKTNIFPFPGSPLCSAMPRQLWCALGVPQSFASPLEAVQGTFQVAYNFCLSKPFCVSVSPVWRFQRQKELKSVRHTGELCSVTQLHIAMLAQIFRINYVLICCPLYPDMF